MMVLEPDFAALLGPAEQSVEGLMALEGTVYRALEGRRTIRIVRGGHGIFVKQHFGIGWGEIAKNLLALRRPVLGAEAEWRALRHLQAAGIGAPRPLGFAARGRNPARRQSVVAMAELCETASLEEVVRKWRRRPPAPAGKWALIAAVADLARRMHDSGLNHRDFYLCHILRHEKTGTLSLLDLHRAQIRHRVPRRWRIKDLSALLFSAAEAGLTRRDLLRFMAAYRGRPWRALLEEEADLWRVVERKAARIARHDARLQGRLKVPVAVPDGAR